MSSHSSRLALAGFDLVFGPWMRRRLHAVRFAGLPPSVPPGPLLLAANHVSWWDGFLLRELHRRLRPRAPLFTVMLQRELRRRPLFRALGCVGMDPDSPTSVAATVRELRRRRQHEPDMVLALFPQGSIWPSHRRPLGFRRGVELFARHLAPATVLPVALHLEPLTAAAPTAFVVAGEPRPAGQPESSAVAVEAAVHQRLDLVLRFLARHGEGAAAAWPGPHALPAAEPEMAGVP